MQPITEAVASGRLANLDAVLSARQSIIDSGSAAGSRAIDVQVWDGISLRAYPDRGLDLGQAWFRGIPLAWVSTVGEVPALADPREMAWGEAFGGGLMATCGLRNVGMPSEGHGLHGTYSHLAAAGVNIERFVEEEAAGVTISGVVDDPAPPAGLRLARTIRSYAGVGRVEIEDVTTNIGEMAAEAPVLYHFNFGYPLWSAPARLDMAVAATAARDAASEVALGFWDLPPPIEVAPERVLEHTLDPGDPVAQARITNPRLGIALTLRWETAALPRLNQWIDPNPEMAVLGIEPANCSTRGRAFDRAAGVLPVLEPGESRTTRLMVEVSGL